jgi:predicted nucleotidyltransferase
MIIEKGSEIKILRDLCASPFDRFSVAEISEATGISRNWVYRAIGKFEKAGILEKSGKGFKLDFTNPFCRRLKLLFDSEYLLSLDPETRSRLSSISDRIIFEANPESVVLVGSAASGKQRKGSDLDFLVVGESRKMPYFENCNIVALTVQELREKYLKGDDFIISALISGRIMHDGGEFARLLESPLPIFSREIIQEKISYCEKFMERIYSLVKSDERQAGKELLYLALQAARIALIRKGIVPKTKYDIAGQVRPLNQKLAEIIDELLEGRQLGKEKIIARMKACMAAVTG